MVKKNFTRKDLSKKIYQNIGFSKNLSSNLIDDFFDVLINDLLTTNIIKITSFGTFKIINKKERIGRNPKTKVKAIISSRRIVKFTPSSLLKKKLNN